MPKLAFYLNATPFQYVLYILQIWFCKWCNNCFLNSV